VIDRIGARKYELIVRCGRFDRLQGEVSERGKAPTCRQVEYRFPLFVCQLVCFEVSVNTISFITNGNSKKKTYTGYKTERKASKSLRLTSLTDMIVGRAS